MLRGVWGLKEKPGMRCVALCSILLHLQSGKGNIVRFADPVTVALARVKTHVQPEKITGVLRMLSGLYRFRLGFMCPVKGVNVLTSNKAYGYCALILAGIAILLGVEQANSVENGENRNGASVRNGGFAITGSDLASAETRAWDFVRGKMTAANGVISYRIDHKGSSPDAVLESAGQAMEYLALTGDSELFGRYAQAADRCFRTEQGYYAWKISMKDGAQDRVTASLDDLRLFKARFLAAERGGKDRSSELKSLADDIYRFDVNRIDDSDWLVSCYDGKSDSRATDIALFYLDVKTMSDLASLDPRWQQPLDNAKSVLLQIPGASFGFYPARYDIAKKKYVSGESVDMIENLYTAIFVHEAGGNTTAFADFLKKEIAEKKAIHNDYTRDGKAVNPDECAAVYALAARFLDMSGEKKAADRCYEKLLSAQIGAGDGFAGGFSMDGQSFYAFDQLEALLALRAREPDPEPTADSGAGGCDGGFCASTIGLVGIFLLKRRAGGFPGARRDGRAGTSPEHAARGGGPGGP